MLKLVRRANQVIKSVLLPEASRRTNRSVNLQGLVMFPTFALYQHQVFVLERREQVNMVGHYYKVGQFIPFPVELLQTFGDDLCHVRIFEDASTVTSIQFVVPLG